MSRFAFLLLTSTLLAAPVAAFADHAEEKAEPLKVTVHPAPRSLTSAGVEEAEARLSQIPGGVAVVDAEDFKDTRAFTMKDMLDFTPGVFAQSRVAQESRMSIRGSGLSRTFHMRGITLLQDGVPINNADGAADFQDIDPLAFRYVEVYKGANALKYGAASLGGAVNFVTPTGYDADEVLLRAEYGSFDTHRLQAASGDVVGDSDYFASLSNYQSSGFRQHSHTNNTIFSGNVGHKINDNLETRVYLTLGDVDQELPGSLTKAQLAANPKQANAGQLANNHQRDFQVMRLANKTTWSDGVTTVNGGAFVKYKDLFHPIFQLIDQVGKEAGVYGDVTEKTALFSHANEYTLGTRLTMGNTNADRFSHTAGVQGVQTASAVERARNIEVYGENRWDATPEVTLIAGGQVIHAIRDFEDNLGTRSGERSFTGFSPKIGALWQASHNTQVFTNLSRAYEPPVFGELTQALPGVTGLTDVDAQKSTTLELGSRGHWRGLEWDASVYRAWMKDEIMTFNVGILGAAATVNADDTIHQGLELGLGAEVWKGLVTAEDSLKWRVAYSYNDFRFDGDATFGDNQIPGAPKHYMRSELRYTHPQGWFVAPQLEWVPEGYPIDMANTFSSDGYATFGLNTGMDLTEKVSVYVDARNLTNEKYAATTGVIVNAAGVDQAQFLPGEGRAIYAGLKVKW